MSLFAALIHVALTQPELEAFARINTDTSVPGGWQRLHERILKAFALGPNLLEADLEDTDLQKVAHYAFTGSGGFQNGFKIIYRAAIRAGWLPPA